MGFRAFSDFSDRADLNRSALSAIEILIGIRFLISFKGIPTAYARGGWLRKIRFDFLIGNDCKGKT
jgi:hypothetical protein